MDQIEPPRPGRGQPCDASTFTVKNHSRISGGRVKTLAACRDLIMVAVPVLILQTTSSSALVTTTAETLNRDALTASVQSQVVMVAQTTKPRPKAKPRTPAQVAQAPREIATLSAQAKQVSEIAIHNGDRQFILVDKVRSMLFLFQDGKPVFSGTVLTGISTSDRLTPELLAKPFDSPTKDYEKITPAGRFTVSQQYDDLYGTILEINEIHGKDWALAIHRVYVGSPKEKRMERLNSATPDDNYVSYGCINIDQEGIQFLVKAVPKKGTPLYILPRDESSTSSFFAKDQKANPPKAE